MKYLLGNLANNYMSIWEASPFVERYWIKNSRSFVKSYREDIG